MVSPIRRAEALPQFMEAPVGLARQALSLIQVKLNPFHLWLENQITYQQRDDCQRNIIHVPERQGLDQGCRERDPRDGQKETRDRPVESSRPNVNCKDEHGHEPAPEKDA